MDVSETGWTFRLRVMCQPDPSFHFHNSSYILTRIETFANPQ